VVVVVVVVVVVWPLGFSGILWAPVSGKAMSELILSGSSQCVDLAPFTPNRFMRDARKEGRGRKKGAQAVGEQW
jgi:hypothetical protein